MSKSYAKMKLFTCKDINQIAAHDIFFITKTPTINVASWNYKTYKTPKGVSVGCIQI